MLLWSHDGCCGHPVCEKGQTNSVISLQQHNIGTILILSLNKNISKPIIWMFFSPTHFIVFFVTLYLLILRSLRYWSPSLSLELTL